MIQEPLIALAADPAHDTRVRKLIRMGLAQRSAAISQEADTLAQSFIRRLSDHPLGGSADANRQHYAVSSGFFTTVLGPHLKYSCCLWERDVQDLGSAEQAMLDCVIARARLADGQKILDLGCGWGALSLELSRRFPSARITALSSAAEQRRFIEKRRDAAGYRNLQVATGDIGEWSCDQTFDRIVSVEMFEHIRNWPALIQKISDWLRPGGLLFVHIFCHAKSSYFFEDDITAKYFFTGGMMPARDLLPRCCPDLSAQGTWQVSGTHYQRTADAWLRLLDANAEAAKQSLATGDDSRSPEDQYAAWRLFFLITSESFGFNAGQSWMVSHYLFGKP